MVTYNLSDTVDITDFPYAWRVTEERWARLPDALLHRLKCLNSEKAAAVCQQGRGFRAPNALINGAEYHGKIGISLDYENDDGIRCIREHLLSLPIRGSEEVYVSWSNDAALISDWSTFCLIWDDLWYPFDVIEVFDDSLDWAVLMGPEEYAIYVESGHIREDMPDIELTYGHLLIQSMKKTIPYDDGD
jgi:hypothetical protein